MNHSSSIRRVTQDIVDLFELQMELFSVDAQATQRKVIRAAIYSVIALALGGSALTVVFLGGGVLLHELSGLSVGASLLIIGGIIFVIVAILLYLAHGALQTASAAMSESKSEFLENFRWLKATLISPSTSPRNQLRAENFPLDDVSSGASKHVQSNHRQRSSFDGRTSQTHR